MNSIVIYEKSLSIPIQKPNILSKNINDYSLKQNFFDPSKSSPPNDFLYKLNMRMKIYENYYDIKEDKCDKE